jgi:predicted small integral membrane protein
MANRPDVAFNAPVEPAAKKHRGFLPIRTNAFDRIFIGVVLYVAIHLFWMRFLEPAGLSLYVATVLSLAVGAAIMARG